MGQFKEEVVKIKGEFELEGTLTIPQASLGKFPAVLIIPGTGKTNRDGNMKGIHMNVYKEMADTITALGFVTLRYDKRGTHNSKGNYMETGFVELVDDAESAVRYLQTRPEVDKENIIVLGHSEGCFITPSLNKRIPLAGVILLAGAAEAGKTMLDKQNKQVNKEIAEMPGFKGKLLRFAVKIQRSEKMQENLMKKVLSSDKPVHKIFGLIPLNAKWIRETHAYDVTKDLPAVACPTLAVTGSNDIQVEPEHAKLFADLVSGESEWHIIPHMNHILRKYEKPHTMLNVMKEYKPLFNKPMEPELMKIVCSWLKKNYLNNENGRDSHERIV